MGWRPLEQDRFADEDEPYDTVLVKKDDGGYVVSKANHHPISRFASLRDAVSFAKTQARVWEPSDEVARELDRR